MENKLVYILTDTETIDGDENISVRVFSSVKLAINAFLIAREATLETFLEDVGPDNCSYTEDEYDEDKKLTVKRSIEKFLAQDFTRPYKTYALTWDIWEEGYYCNNNRLLSLRAVNLDGDWTTDISDKSFKKTLDEIIPITDYIKKLKEAKN